MTARTIDLSATAIAYHRRLPERLWQYLRERGIPNVLIHRYRLGWDGERIAIPITNRDRQVVFFKRAKDPDDLSDRPKMLSPAGSKAELYGWERVMAKPPSIVICEGEFDRLVLEAQGFSAVTSTAGVNTFLWEWAESFVAITKVYICFDNDAPGRRGALRVASMIPHASILRLPPEVGKGGDVTDFFVRLGKTRQDFQRLLETAEPVPPQEKVPVAQLPGNRWKAQETIEELKAKVRIEVLFGRYVSLRQSGERWVARCPFHNDRNPSFVVYPNTRAFHCFGCQAHGDVLSFLMRIEQLSFPEAVRLLQTF